MSCEASSEAQASGRLFGPRKSGASSAQPRFLAWAIHDTPCSKPPLQVCRNTRSGTLGPATSGAASSGRYQMTNCSVPSAELETFVACFSASARRSAAVRRLAGEGASAAMSEDAERSKAMEPRDRVKN